jgi:pimeloyl-ACP methyl ester carboxylesterase
MKESKVRPNVLSNGVNRGSFRCMRKVTVFFHGMNTFDDDRLHVGPLKFGFMHERWEKEFKARGRDFIPALKIGAGRFEDQAEVTYEMLKAKGLLHDEETELHFLCHSAGGLVARVLAARPDVKDKVKTIITMGTPHHGTSAAQLGSGFSKKFPRAHKVAQRLNYDTEAKASSFSHFTQEAMQEFNKKYPAHQSAKEIAILCTAHPFEISLPFLPLYLPLHPRLEPSDGFIHHTSQVWGETQGPVKVDHFGILGAFFALSPWARKRAQNEFERLSEMVFSIISE